MKEEFAKFLLSKGYYLTALEFHQELLEGDGTELPALKEYFQSLTTSTQDPLRIIKERKKQQGIVSNESDKSKDEKISLLEYELRQSREDIIQLKEQLKSRLNSSTTINNNSVDNNNNNNSSSNGSNSNVEQQQQTSSSSSNSSNSNIDSKKQLDSVSKEKIKSHEKKILNYLFRKYLSANGYPLTSVTFSEESEDSARNWSDLQLNQPEPPSLLTIYRYFFENGDSGVQGVLTKTMGEIAKLKKELADNEGHWRNIQKEKEQLHLKLKESNIIIEQLKKNQLSGSSAVGMLTTSTSSSTTSTTTTTTTTSITSPNTQLQQQQHRKSLEMNASDVSVMRNTFRSMVDKRRQTVAFQIVSNDDESEASMRIADEVEQLRSHDSDQLGKIVKVIASSLPHILPGVLLNKREELIPLILVVISNHPDETTRFALTKLLFNLIKKPNEFQRHAIMKGCMALASIVGPQRTETEILSQCWEQLTEKHPERRVLVADSCGSLAQFASPDLRLSLILSILQQLGQDKSALVRIAVAKNFSLLINFFDGTDKYNQVEESFKALIYDTEAEVSLATRVYFLPSLANWTDLLESLNSKLTNLLLTEMYSLVHRYTNQKEEFKIPEQDILKLEQILACFMDLVPRIHQSLISSSPLISEKEAKNIENEYDRQEAIYQYQMNENKSKLNQQNGHGVDANGSLNGGEGSSSSSGRASTASSESTASSSSSSTGAVTNSSNRISILGKSETARLHAQFEQYLMSLVNNDVSSPNWKSLEWISTDFINKLLNILYCIPMRNTRLISLFAKALNVFCTVFGQVFTKRVVKSAFYKEFQKDSRGNEAPVKKYRLVPIFAAGVLHSLESSELNTFLSDIVVQISMEERGWDHSNFPALVKSMELLCNNDFDKKKDVGQILSNLTANPSNQVRSCILNLYKVIIPVFSPQQISNTIVPSLITMSTDPDRTVRMVCIGALSIVLSQLSEDNAIEKIAIAFEKILDDKNHNLEVEFVQSITKIIPTVKPRYRDSFFLPKIVETNSSGTKVVVARRSTTRSIVQVNGDIDDQRLGVCSQRGSERTHQEEQ
ncbi:hypothetical protein PPL_06295 [Heterostelium album PN500]|uniref:LisH domain-containing protein n=1 Tax=Heterostelium pallidum (strain ATCC 26659 / Pp 5 / PN500) TaxID=670386 RepID=D3BCR7_HETP5|nr:hypothetical protein PPL_06295 [Heterostelium album PN500]EFA80709.1 hypothetical protein PPL_06295 [Heterostelium album PN500]|eukprot:XP_020432829.1 hypothetical protein PPL_06295 [Heterostelium album PN500]